MSRGSRRQDGRSGRGDEGTAHDDGASAREDGRSRRARSVPSRGGSRRWLWTLVVAVLLIGAAVPASSYDTATLDRPSMIGVVTDTDGVLGIDHAQTVAKPSDTLVVVTNQFERERTISVALTRCTANTLSLKTTGSNSSGVLVSNTGTNVTFHLPAGGSQAVIIENIDTQCDPIRTRITTTDELVHVTADRAASPEQGSGGGGGGGQPGTPGNGNGNGNAKLANEVL